MAIFPFFSSLYVSLPEAKFSTIRVHLAELQCAQIISNGMSLEKDHGGSLRPDSIGLNSGEICEIYQKGASFMCILQVNLTNIYKYKVNVMARIATI